MADRVAGIHEKFHGDLDVKIAEIHELMQSMSNVEDSPTLWPTHKDRPVSPGDFWSPGLKKRDLDSNLISSYNTHHNNVHKESYPVTPGRTPELQGTEPSPGPKETTKKMGGRPRVGSVEQPARIWTTDEAAPPYDKEWRKPATEYDTHPAGPKRIMLSSNSYEARSETPRPIAHASPVPSVGTSISNVSHASPVPSLTMSPWTTSHATPVPSLGVTPSGTPQIPPRSIYRLPSSASSNVLSRTSIGSINSNVTNSSQQSLPPNTAHVPSELSMRISQTGNYVSSTPSIDSRLPSLLPSPILPVQEAQSYHSNSVVSSYMPVHDPTEILPIKDTVAAAATDMEHSLFERELTRDSATLCEA